MNLSTHFTLAELTITQQRNLSNDPPPEIVSALRRTAANMEAVRARLGCPVIVSSGYRSPEVNTAVGGSPSSQHCKGEAIDFIAPRFGSPLDVVYAIRDSAEIEYDQLIAEYTSNRNGGWVHVSFCDKPRRQAFMLDGRGARPLT
jgi:Peptidase M15